MRKLIIAAVAAAAVGLMAGGAMAGEKVRIGTEGAYPPFNWIDSGGKLQGFDIDIADALCAAAELDCEFVVQDWDGIIPGLIAKKYDAIIASMSITPKRAEVVDFTGKYYNTPAKFVAAKDAGFDMSPAALAGKAVGVQRSTTHEDFLRKHFPDVEIRAYATQDEANADLVSGRLDLVMANSVALDEGFLSTEEGACCAFIGGNYNDPEIHGVGAGIAIRKGEGHLVEAFNKALAAIRADGTYQKINAKYFDFDVYGE